MRIGVQLHPQHADYADIRRAVIAAEEMGVDVIYNWDHFYPLYGAPDGKHFEAWTMLASWAEITERVEIGPLVTCNSYRNPQLLADMARTVDHISNGRLILGIGSGWFQRDYTEFGYDFGTAGGRLRHLDANMPVIKERLEKLTPQPVRNIPILIGGGGEKVTLRIVAEHADIWHGFYTSRKPDEYAHKNRVLNDWCARVGRDPVAIERSVGVDPQKIETAGRLVESGAQQVTLGFNGPDYDLTVVADWLAWRDELSAA
jgi:probable F420-dependent oxidoreductase